ncbi:MAG: hypothetical protein ACNA77_10050 [Opitutales bacterium]
MRIQHFWFILFSCGLNTGHALTPKQYDTKLILDDVAYRMALSGERFDGVFERMLKQQQLIHPSEEHPAIGVWALTRKLASDVKPYA